MTARLSSDLRRFELPRRSPGRGPVPYSFRSWRSPLSRDQRNSFRCRNCRLDVPLDAPGTAHRNHCPNCLWSRHLDDSPGDRSSECGSSMEPIAVCVRGGGEWVLVHRCTGCDTLHLNRTAGDDNPLPLMRLAVKPLAQPPFPLEWLTQL
ncbi:MAG TPA: RNHCP domain-containing protein [Acidimicrobiales bacterium]